MKITARMATFIGSLAGGAIAFFCLTFPAFATYYPFTQTGSTVPGFNVTADY